MSMKSLLRLNLNCLRRGMCLPHLQKVSMNIVMQLLPPHLVRRVQRTMRCLKTCLTPSQQQRSLKRPHVDPRWNQVYAICVMSRSLGNVTLLLFKRCHVMHAVQPTTFDVPS